MAQNNAINNSLLDLTVDPATSADSFIQFNINTTGEFRIGADNTDSSFRISQGSALGTNDTLVISSAGEITAPLTPAFSAYLASTVNNVTGDATDYTLGTSALTEIFDQNSDFNTNGTFTAPVTGRYFLCFIVSIETPAGGGTQGAPRLSTSNRFYSATTWPQQDLVANFYGNSGRTGFRGQCIADMDAADTATVIVNVAGGAKTADVTGSGAVMYTLFSGYLLT